MYFPKLQEELVSHLIIVGFCCVLKIHEMHQDFVLCNSWNVSFIRGSFTAKSKSVPYINLRICLQHSYHMLAAPVKSIYFFIILSIRYCWTPFKVFSLIVFRFRCWLVVGNISAWGPMQLAVQVAVRRVIVAPYCVKCAYHVKSNQWDITDAGYSL